MPTDRRGRTRPGAMTVATEVAGSAFHRDLNIVLLPDLELDCTIIKISQHLTIHNGHRRIQPGHHASLY